MDITREEFLNFIKKLFPTLSNNGQERTIIFEISKDEIYDNFLQKMFTEEFEKNKFGVFTIEHTDLKKFKNKKPFFTSVTIAGQLIIKLKIK